MRGVMYGCPRGGRVWASKVGLSTVPEYAITPEEEEEGDADRPEVATTSVADTKTALASANEARRPR